MRMEEESVFFRKTSAHARGKADCSACRYCMPDTSGVDIPAVIAALNSASAWNDPNPWTTGYSRIDGKAAKCITCGVCENICPQFLPITSRMTGAGTIF